jgi:hypothetical protein
MTNGKPHRAQRLAEALRANLRRRKGQARDRALEEADQTAVGPDEATRPLASKD